MKSIKFIAIGLFSCACAGAVLAGPIDALKLPLAAARTHSVPPTVVAACPKGEITCREYCAKCNPVSACEVACVRMNNRCVGSACRAIHK